MSLLAHRRLRAARRFRPAPEAVEARLLLSADSVDLGAFPLRNIGSENSILVRFREDAAIAEALNSIGGFVEETFPTGTRSVVLGRGLTPESAIARLSLRNDVIFAEPNARIERAGDVVPNDAQFGQLWGLNNRNNVDIDAPQAWGITQGAPVIVAVIDSGIDLRHPDLASKFWVNTAEVGGNRRDDDRNGYVDDVNGWNFVRNNANVQDENGHGSHIAGVIAAAGNNNYGVVGVNWNARILPLKFLDSSGSGSTEDAVAAIYYAVAKGARVINASWGGQGFSRALNEAILYAASKNVVFVTAAGNETVDNDVRPSWPANYRHANTLSVTAVDRNGRLADFANWGASSVDIAAPGVGITSTTPGGRFSSYSGTSMAAPYVAGVASLVISTNPELTASQVVAAIRASAKPLESLQGLIATGGIVSASRALTAGIQTALGRPVVEAPPFDVDALEVALLSSEEFSIRSGSSAVGLVTGMYRTILGRDPEPSGLAAAVTSHSNGLSPDDLARNLQSSREAALTKAARWFQSILGRTQSLDALKGSPEVGPWASLVEGGSKDADIQAALLSSTEFRLRSGGNSDGFTRALYRYVLDRDPESSAFQEWRAVAGSTEARHASIRWLLGSDEAKRVVTARMYRSTLGRSASTSQLVNDPGVIGWSERLEV